MGGGAGNCFQSHQGESCRSNKIFHVYPNTRSNFAFGTVLVQDGTVISTFSRKFNDTQSKYTVTDQELFTIFEACKHFKQIIHGCKIMMHTIHKNLTFSTAQQSNDRAKRALIQLHDKFRVKLDNILGEEDTAADGLNRLAHDENLVDNNTIFAI
jgi:hypothetical protein